MREDQAVLAVDMCQDGVLRAITYKSTNLLNGARITKNAAGNSYKVVLLFVLSNEKPLKILLSLAFVEGLLRNYEHYVLSLLIYYFLLVYLLTCRSVSGETGWI
jgi:hypothetical protein